MHGYGSSFFEGLTQQEVTQVLHRLERRQIPAGATMLVEGDDPREVYVIQDGTADVFVTDRHGAEHWVSRVGPGATLGEMSVLTGQPVSATVRTSTDVDVLVISESEFFRIAAAYPRIFRNIGAILADRLARSNRRSTPDASGNVVALLHCGAPPLLGYALACSVAWHTRSATLLLVIADGSPPAELTALATTSPTPLPPSRSGSRSGAARAHLKFTTLSGALTAEALTRIVQQFHGDYEYVLIQVYGGSYPPLPVRTVYLAGPRDPVPGDRAGRPGHTIRAWASGRRLPRPDGDGVLHVPGLGPADEEALRNGTLPTATPAGGVLGWAARDLAGLKVGLALGAGSARGYAHIGVLKALSRAGIAVDYVAGTSIGAAMGAMLACGYDLQAMVRYMDEVASVVFRPTLSTTSLLSNVGVRTLVRQLAGERRMEDLSLPLAVVATDIVTGQEVLLRRGLLWPAVMASMAIPGIFRPARLGRYMLVDGGLVNPVPSNVAAEMGADKVIAVKLSRRPASPGAQAGAGPQSGRPPSVIAAIVRSIETMQSKIVTDTAAAATIVIAPDFAGSGPGLRRIIEGRRYVALGETAVETALPRIAAALPWIRD
jgi:NTE family protein